MEVLYHAWSLQLPLLSVLCAQKNSGTCGSNSKAPALQMPCCDILHSNPSTAKNIRTLGPQQPWPSSAKQSSLPLGDFPRAGKYMGNTGFECALFQAIPPCTVHQCLATGSHFFGCHNQLAAWHILPPPSILFIPSDDESSRAHTHQEIG